MSGHMALLKQLQPGERKAGSAFFKPITTEHSGRQGGMETDEVKLGAMGSGVKLIRPTPTIRLNDAELRLSPGSPQTVPLSGNTVTGFTVPDMDPSDEVRAIFERGSMVKNDSLEAQPVNLPGGRESPSTRRDSINQLQRLQQHNRVPRLGGKVLLALSFSLYNLSHLLSLSLLPFPLSPLLPSPLSLSLPISLPLIPLPSVFPLSPPSPSPPPLPLSLSSLPQFISSLKPSEDLLHDGKKFTFRVTILQATGIPRDFTDVFVQFRFLHGGDEAFSTEPLKNENQDLALGFYHMQNVRSV